MSTGNHWEEGRNNTEYYMSVVAACISIVTCLSVAALIGTVKRLRFDYSARVCEALMYTTTISSIGMLMNPSTHTGDIVESKESMCQIQAFVVVFSRTCQYGLVIMVLHSEYMVLRHGIYPWRLVWHHTAAVLFSATIVSVVPMSFNGFGHQYYGKCGIRVDNDAGKWSLFGMFVGQTCCFVIVCIMMHLLRTHLVAQSDMISKPVSGAFYGSSIIQEKLKLHWPYYQMAILGMITASASILVEAALCYVSIAENNDGASTTEEDMIDILFPLSAISDAVFGIFSVIIFFYPQRDIIRAKLEIYAPCLMRICGAIESIRSDDLEVNPAIQYSLIQQAATRDGEYRTLLGTHTHLEEGRPRATSTMDIADMDRFRESRHGSVESPSLGVSPEATATLSPRSPPQDEDIVDGSLGVNPVFGQRPRSATDAELQGGGEVGVLGPSS